MQVICKNCDRPFGSQHPRAGRPRLHCSPECGVTYHRRLTKLRYRNDPTFREAMKTTNLQRHHDRKAGRL